VTLQACLGVGTSGRGEDIRKVHRRVIWWKFYLLMNENRKMRPAESILIMGKRIKENDGGGRG
jgi:hypothetical protein